MLTRKYLSTLVFAAASLVLTPAMAQDESDDMIAGLEESTTADETVASEEEEADTPAKGKKGKKLKKNKKKGQDSDEVNEEPNVVGDALKELKTLKGKPNFKADYYIYMYSAGWCGFCRKSMPTAVDEYKKIKRSKKVEFIVINGDKSAAEAKNYMKSYKAKIAYVMFDEVKNAQFKNLPGSGAGLSFPGAVIVDKSGKVITRAIGYPNVPNMIAEWKKWTIDADKKAARSEG